MTGKRLVALCAVMLLALGVIPRVACATSDPLIGLLAAEGGAGLGLVTRFEQSPYRGAGTRNDLVPLYLYEGEKFYLHAYRLGWKFDDQPNSRFDVFLSHRFEGFPNDRIPASLAGMTGRQSGVDAGIGYERRGEWGSIFGELLHDASGTSHGNEFRLGYLYDWHSGRLHLLPNFTISARDAKLNDYYYGVLPSEATAGRPAYSSGAGVNSTIGLYSRYELSQRWRLLAGVSATHWPAVVRQSPIVDSRQVSLAGFLGFAYDFSPEQKPFPERRPLIVKALYGRSTDCNLVPVMRLSCTSTHTEDGTSIASLEIGRPFIEGLNGWPLDIVGYVGLLRHNERGLQPDSWEINAYMKAFYYGFPWKDRVRTRIGFGTGISYAQRVPFVEARDQARRGRTTSKLLQYIDPSIDVSIGDLFGWRALRETYFGFGASHRSGIFGNSQVLGNVNGGSNYIYSYVEWKM
jgi:MipA family protein